MDIRGVYGFSSLMKQNKKGENCAVFCFAGKRKLLYLYLPVITGKNKKKALLITTQATVRRLPVAAFLLPPLHPPARHPCAASYRLASMASSQRSLLSRSGTRAAVHERVPSGCKYRRTLQGNTHTRSRRNPSPCLPTSRSSRGGNGRGRAGPQTGAAPAV